MYLYPLFTFLREAAEDFPAQAIPDSASAKKMKGVEEEKKVAGGDEADDLDEEDGADDVDDENGVVSVRLGAAGTMDEEGEVVSVTSAADNARLAARFPSVVAQFATAKKSVLKGLDGYTKGTKFVVGIVTNVHRCDGLGGGPPGHICDVDKATAERVTERLAEEKRFYDVLAKKRWRKHDADNKEAEMGTAMLSLFNLYGRKTLEMMGGVHEGVLAGVSNAEAHLERLLRLESRNEETSYFFEKARINAHSSSERARVDMKAVATGAVLPGSAGESQRKLQHAKALSLCAMYESRAQAELAEMDLLHTLHGRARSDLKALIEEVTTSVQSMQAVRVKSREMMASVKEFATKRRFLGVE